MGGGGMMRAVGKVSAIAASRGLRGAPTVPAAEHATRGVGRQVESISASQSGKISGGVTQASATELDDWELAVAEDDLLMSSGEPLPRLVFGAAPTFEEAKEATDELKDALEKVYLSSPAAAESGDSPSMVDAEIDAEKKYIIATDQSVISPPAPKHAVQAFKLLTQNAAAQNVVASIASDPNVWNAVLHNEALMDFLQSQKTASVVEFPSEELTVRTVEDAMSHNLESMDESSSGNAENGFMKVLKDIKCAVEQMVSNVSCFLHNIFSPNPDEKSAAHEEGGNGGSTNLGASFFGLAVLAIIVVLLKRH